MNTLNKILVGLTIILVCTLVVMLFIVQKKKQQIAQHAEPLSRIEKTSPPVSINLTTATANTIDYPPTITIQPERYYPISLMGTRIFPALISIPTGNKVTFVNKDRAPVTIVSTENAFAEKKINAGERYDVDLSKSGTYTYYMKELPQVKGTITIQ